MAFELLISLPHALILKEIWIVLHSVLHCGACYISVKLLHQLLCVVLILFFRVLQLVLHLLGQSQNVLSYNGGQHPILFHFVSVKWFRLELLNIYLVIKLFRAKLEAPFRFFFILTVAILFLGWFLKLRLVNNAAMDLCFVLLHVAQRDNFGPFVFQKIVETLVTQLTHMKNR